MVNMDFPGVCLSCVDENCKVEPSDVGAAVKRIRESPLTGYTKTIVSNLQSSFPDKFKSDAEAYMALDVIKAIIAMGLKNADTVDIEGLGEFRTEPSGGRKKIVFAAERVLADAINE